MATYSWDAAIPQKGAYEGVQQRIGMDPDVYGQLQQRSKEFDWQKELQGAQFGFKVGAFNKLFPYATSMLGNFGQVGGQSTPEPSITRGPLYNQNQIQQQVNTQQAGADARYQTLMRQMAGSAAGRGFGMASPAIQSQMTQLGIANIGENQRIARELPMQYVQANADQTYRTDTLAQQQWQQAQDIDVRRRQTQLQGAIGLLNSLSGII
jgi:hypothetical protein